MTWTAIACCLKQTWKQKGRKGLRLTVCWVQRCSDNESEKAVHKASQIELSWQYSILHCTRSLGTLKSILLWSFLDAAILIVIQFDEHFSQEVEKDHLDATIPLALLTGSTYPQDNLQHDQWWFQLDRQRGDSKMNKLKYVFQTSS